MKRTRRNEILFADVCKMDVILKPDELIFLKNEEVPAIYILFVKKEAMYVGQSRNVYQRVNQHLRKYSSTTSSIANDIDEIGIHFVKEPLTNEPFFLEMAYMFEFNPPLNIRRNKTTAEKTIERQLSRYCKNCYRTAHENGFCGYHCGNGITIKMIAKSEIDKAFSEHIQLKLII